MCRPPDLVESELLDSRSRRSGCEVDASRGEISPAGEAIAVHIEDDEQADARGRGDVEEDRPGQGQGVALPEVERSLPVFGLSSDPVDRGVTDEQHRSTIQEREPWIADQRDRGPRAVRASRNRRLLARGGRGGALGRGHARGPVRVGCEASVDLEDHWSVGVLGQRLWGGEMISWTQSTEVVDIDDSEEAEGRVLGERDSAFDGPGDFSLGLPPLEGRLSHGAGHATRVQVLVAEAEQEQGGFPLG